MSKLLLMLMPLIFLFNACTICPEPKDKLVYINKKPKKLRILPDIDASVPEFSLYKEDFNASKEYKNVYVVDKTQLFLASKNTQVLRFKVNQLHKQVKIYKYQNIKINKANFKDSK